MSIYTDNIRKAIETFQASLETFRKQVQEVSPSDRFPKDRLDELQERIQKAEEATKPLKTSAHLLDVTSLDVVDLETRLSLETRKLGEALKKLGEEVREQSFVRQAFNNEVFDCDEKAQILAGAIFPSGVRGLKSVNHKIREFAMVERQQRKKLERVGREETLSSSEQSAVELKFSLLSRKFDDSNEFLNQLASDELDHKQIPDRIEQAQRVLEEVQNEADSLLDESPFHEFKGILRDTSRIARQVAEELNDLQIPFFPSYDGLEDLKSCIDQNRYDNLTGVGQFALLNIASRMRSIETSDGEHLLSPNFEIQIWKVLPDRIYFDANPFFIRHIAGRSDFDEAPASLHLFRHGSYKQTTERKGNLQVSYQTEHLPEGEIAHVDADIDLYRDPLTHLFGEVFVNRLTGSKTDQYEVREILDKQEVRPIGAFEIHRLG